VLPLTPYTNTQNHYNESITGHKKLKKLDNVKIGNLKKKNRDHKSIPCDTKFWREKILTK